jgi:hypothetical protein
MAICEVLKYIALLGKGHNISLSLSWIFICYSQNLTSVSKQNVPFIAQIRLRTRWTACSLGSKERYD